ncbi:hypothetical protein A3D88_03900 [Candidatus Peribacteria bacterium RIFCSPHIGHO2_02_FULL_52_16]|nr:MAG: hypothetical protein A2706_04715 [Candidatus Peribacteria bacterium RIFCSPHIGHO2_01_FULL_51_35]OGJ61824.1 MAG: hypothetical protein A3D88_03900 [Candidatus Peribacteria bacterium RIFCSPHIGHO2_02_FULL_52_16]
MNRALFRNRYRVASHRKRETDYAASTCYFVTICTKDRMPWFGEIRNGIMGLSDVGCVIREEWERNAILRPDIQLGLSVIMPNHIHGIMYIDAVEIDRWSISPRSIQQSISGAVASCIPLARRRAGELGSIIAQFKGACTKHISAMGYTDFAWQRNYHDHIIRDKYAYNAIEQYIVENPRRFESGESYDQPWVYLQEIDQRSISTR